MLIRLNYISYVGQIKLLQVYFMLINDYIFIGIGNI